MKFNNVRKIAVAAFLVHTQGMRVCSAAGLRGTEDPRGSKNLRKAKGNGFAFNNFALALAGLAATCPVLMQETNQMARVPPPAMNAAQIARANAMNEFLHDFAPAACQYNVELRALQKQAKERGNFCRAGRCTPQRAVQRASKILDGMPGGSALAQAARETPKYHSKNFLTTLHNGLERIDSSTSCKTVFADPIQAAASTADDIEKNTSDSLAGYAEPVDTDGAMDFLASYPAPTVPADPFFQAAVSQCDPNSRTGTCDGVHHMMDNSSVSTTIPSGQDFPVLDNSI